MIATMRRDAEYRLQIHPQSVFNRGTGYWQEVGFRMASAKGWHCGHWHRTPEDAVACAVAKGAPMA